MITYLSGMGLKSDMSGLTMVLDIQFAGPGTGKGTRIPSL